MVDERERKWVEGMKEWIKKKTGLELKAETLEELKEELDRLYVIIRDFDEIVSRAYWMRKEREKERDGRE